MNILVEGPDCSGKSTLVERLKNALRWDSKSLHHQEGDQFRRYAREYLLADNCVFDRGHVSEHVYSQIWRGGSPFSQEQVLFLNKLTPLIIFACPPEEVLLQRYHSRKYEQQIKPDELVQVRQLFLESIPQHILYQSSSMEELDPLMMRIQNEIIRDTG